MRPTEQDCRAYFREIVRKTLLPRPLSFFERGMVWGEWEEPLLGSIPAVVSASGDYLLGFWHHPEVGIFAFVPDAWESYFYHE